jgi:hypothetical protein
MATIPSRQNKRIVISLILIVAAGILTISTIRAIQRTQRCRGTVDWCAAKAKSNDFKEVFVQAPLREYGVMSDLGKVLSFCLIVKAHFISEAAKVSEDRSDIDTYRKYRVEILNQSSETCATCKSPIEIPKEVTPGQNEMVVVFGGGTVVVDGVTVTMEEVEPFDQVLKAKDLVLVLFQNSVNPRLGFIATGPKGGYILRNINGTEFLIVNDEAEYWYTHPLVQLFGYQQTKLSFSDFEKKLREARDARKKT